ncbi:MBL fold metallo-hydrolase [Desulfonatronovibrio magnus]|uniref:MBL fold metallo-hydrolase n=1 Tax=Desulfonatronovibrio magnus TaxID=698827 RepID=UPI0005EB0D0A|nr:MBL fold metallo-hydrolase [Desulfonatronovibrio magnus]RQD65380.1 MAG: MBL fold metallo-hydrolase [Desulfonatronovibrio sp. MSAO_Bac4]
MFLEKITSQGLSHLSYLIGHQSMAAVIDPRRDIQIYLDIAHEKGTKITHIFETHRNEDYVIGSVELADITGAQIFHGEELPFAYGKPVREGQTFELGSIILKILKTPGHTFESISIVLYDKDFGLEPVAVFTGDALFIGDVGRTDFFPGQEKETAGLLYDSLFNKILPLGDHVIIYPAHGAGSVCGSGMADREFSTIGYERLTNPMLQLTQRENFIQAKLKEKHSKPPYFLKMEEYNLSGPPAIGSSFSLLPLTPDELSHAVQSGLQIVDIRSPEAFAGAFIPGSFSLPLTMLPLYTGWFISYDYPLGLVAESYEQAMLAVTYLKRIGFDDIQGYLYEGMHEWTISGKDFAGIKAVYAGDIQTRISSGFSFTLLDIRTEEEYQKEHLPGSTHIFIGDLEKRINELDKQQIITTFCGSGMRAIIAASVLKRHGFNNVETCFGSMRACARGVCEIESSL